MISFKRKLENIERKSIQIPSLKDLPEWKGPPSKDELLKLKKDLAIPDNIFDDLFGGKDGN